MREPKPHFSCSIRIKSGQGRAEQLPDDDGDEEDDIHKGVHVCACAGQTEGGGGRDKEGKEIDLMKGARVGREGGSNTDWAAYSTSRLLVHYLTHCKDIHIQYGTSGQYIRVMSQWLT